MTVIVTEMVSVKAPVSVAVTVTEYDIFVS